MDCQTVSVTLVKSSILRLRYVIQQTEHHIGNHTNVFTAILAGIQIAQLG